MSLCLTDPASIAVRRSPATPRFAPWLRLRRFMSAPAQLGEAREPVAGRSDPARAPVSRSPVNVLLL